MHSVVIANPNAGQRRQDEFAALVAQIAVGAGETLLTAAAGDAEKAARAVTEAAETDIIIAAGGDGTLNEIANGILSASLPSGIARPAICIIATGTSNILATELGLTQLSHAQQIQLIQANKRRPIDVGVAENRVFLLMAGFGFDAATVQGVVLPLKELVGQHAYLLSALAALPSYKHSTITVDIDGDEITSDAYMLLVANVSSYGNSTMKIAPFAAVDDGWLDVCLFEKAAVAKIGFVTQFLMMLAHRHLDDPNVRYFRGKHIKVSATPAVFAQLDGDLWGQTPFAIDLKPRALEILVPA